ncbi:hypothetical protein [Candidatus Vidania fulgoroideorum]
MNIKRIYDELFGDFCKTVNIVVNFKQDVSLKVIVNYKFPILRKSIFIFFLKKKINLKGVYSYKEINSVYNAYKNKKVFVFSDIFSLSYLKKSLFKKKKIQKVSNLDFISNIKLGHYFEFLSCKNFLQAIVARTNFSLKEFKFNLSLLLRNIKYLNFKIKNVYIYHSHSKSFLLDEKFY